MPAGIAAGHPATAEVGLRVLAAGGSAADAAVAAVLASCTSESILTGIAGGGFATYYDATSRTVTCLDFFVSIPGLDGDREPGPMVPIEVNFGGVPMNYSIGGASAGVPGVPAGCGEVHRRWGRLPWHQVVSPAVSLARTGVVLPAAQARTLIMVAPAMVPGEGAAIYAPGGQLLQGGDLLFHPGLGKALATLADEGPDAFYTGSVAKAIVDTVRAAGGSIGPADLASYRVLEVGVERAGFAGAHVYARHDLNNTIHTVAALSDAHLLDRPGRVVAIANALRDHARQRIGDTTNISVVDPDGNACVITTTLGLGSGVWLPGLGVHLNSMLGEGELHTDEMHPGRRMSSMMCPLVVTAEPAQRSVPSSIVEEEAEEDAIPAVEEFIEPPEPITGEMPVLPAQDAPTAMTVPDESTGNLLLAAGSAGASRIRTALVHTLVGTLIDGMSVGEAIEAGRFHVVGRTVHVEPGVPEGDLAALGRAGYEVIRWDHTNHYFGGASAVGRTGSAGDLRRGGVGLLL